MTEAGTRPRVLHVTRNLPPLVGGMERLNWHSPTSFRGMPKSGW